MPGRKPSRPITARQREVLRYLWQGMTAREIGKRLRVSHRTVEAHKKALHARAGCNNTQQLLRWAIEIGEIKVKGSAA
jgi:DNA-binding CsgD family transcriptional regulator